MTNPTLNVARHIAANTTFADRHNKPIEWQVKTTLAQHDVMLSKYEKSNCLERLKVLINKIIKEDMRTL